MSLESEKKSEKLPVSAVMDTAAKNASVPEPSSSAAPSTAMKKELELAEGKDQSAEPALSKEEFRSAGRRIHNEITYRGIDWLVNSAIGVGFTYWAERTHTGKQYFSKPVSNFFKKILKPVLKSPAALEEGAKWGSMFTSIMAGGTAIIPVLMFMEDKGNKKSMIKKMDEWYYGKDVVANDPQFQSSYDAIDKEPPKGFAIGMASRLLAIAPLITVASIPATNKVLIKNLYDPIANLTKKAAGAVGIKPSKAMLAEGEKVFLEGDPSLPKKFQNNWDFLHRTIGFDFGLTIFYSIFHEIAYKALAAAGMKKTDAPEVDKPGIADDIGRGVKSALLHDPLDAAEDLHGGANNTATKKYTDTIKPKAPALSEAAPKDLDYRQKLAIEELSQDARTLDRTSL